MPKLDGTGPAGKGAGTGRGMGKCDGVGVRKGCCGRPRGMGRKFSSPKKDELETVQKEVKDLKIQK